MKEVNGVFGDVKPIGEGLNELRIHHGSGYRVYYGKQGGMIYIPAVRWRQVHTREGDEAD